MRKMLVAVVWSVLLLVGGSVAAVGKTGVKPAALNTGTAVLEKRVKALEDKLQAAERWDSMVELYAHGPAVVTSPAMGVRRSAEDGSDLMINLSSINEDLVLLRLRQRMDNYAVEQGLPVPERPIIALSGGVEGVIDYYNEGKKAGIHFSRAELDIVGEASPWATAVINMVYEDSAHAAYWPRVNHSRFKLDRGFLTLGQLNKCPIYLTIGQIFAPFGSYSSYMLTEPLTKSLGRIKNRIILVGYDVGGVWGNLDAQLYGSSGNFSGNHNLADHMGFNLNYAYVRNQFKLVLGGGMVGNLAESVGIFRVIQKTSAGPVEMESATRGLSARAKVGYGVFNLSAEYVGAVGSNGFDINGMVKPKAMQIEGAVDFNLFSRANTLAVGYGRTWQSEVLELPKYVLFTSYGVSIFKNTLLGLEYKHDKHEASHPARSQNVVTMQLGVYF